MSEIDVIESNVVGKGQVSFSQYKTNWKDNCKVAGSILLVVGFCVFLGAVLTGCTPNTVYLQHPKTEILEPERCVKAGDKLIAEKFECKIEGDKFIIDKPNLAILATNIAQLRNAYEELKVCYTNQVDYYVQVANL